ncbi:Hypothetical protein A7982_06418 [Minicystis rosea]|nr:Hypothetical protein A7982_06418 [Minicystis rosea]
MVVHALAHVRAHSSVLLRVARASLHFREISAWTGWHDLC